MSMLVAATSSYLIYVAPMIVCVLLECSKTPLMHLYRLCGALEVLITVGSFRNLCIDLGRLIVLLYWLISVAPQACVWMEYEMSTLVAATFSYLIYVAPMIVCVLLECSKAPLLHLYRLCGALEVLITVDRVYRKKTPLICLNYVSPL